MNFVISERVPVPFEGEGSGVGELTWTQRSIWADMQRAGISLTMTMIRHLPPEATVEEFVDEYRFYLSRFQAMRTVLRFEPDGRVRQVVHGSGTGEIEIYDTGDRDPDEVAYEIEQAYGFGRFDYEHEYPIRLTLVRQAGVLTHLITAISHHAADVTAAMAMFEDRRDRDPVTGQPPRPPGIQPLAQAELQKTPSAKRQNDAALQYWEEQLRIIPPSMFPAKPAHRHDGYWYADYTSPTMYSAARAAAARLGGGIASVLYAAFASALAQWNGMERVATLITVNNRFRPGFANAAGHMVQHGLCTLDIKGLEFDALVSLVRRRLLAARKNGYYVPADVDALVERVGQERGVEFDLLCLYNDRRTDDPPHQTVEPENQPGKATLAWRKVDHLHHRMIFHVNDGPSDALAIQVQHDTAYISRDEVRALLERMERIVGGLEDLP